MCVILAEFEGTGCDPHTVVVDESRVFRYDEIDKYEPEGHPHGSYAYRHRVLRSVRRLLRNSPDGLGVDEVVGGGAVDRLEDSAPYIDIGRPREFPQFRLLALYTMRSEVSLYFENFIIGRFAYLPASCARLVVSNESFADAQLLDNNGIVGLTWRSRKDDKALARAIRLAVAQQRSALAA